MDSEYDWPGTSISGLQHKVLFLLDIRDLEGRKLCDKSGAAARSWTFLNGTVQDLVDHDLVDIGEGDSLASSRYSITDKGAYVLEEIEKHRGKPDLERQEDKGGFTWT